MAEKKAAKKSAAKTKAKKATKKSAAKTATKPAAKPAPKTAVAPADASHPLADFRSQMDRLFDEFFAGWPMPAFGRLWEHAPVGTELIAVHTDVSETADSIHVTAELPGMEEKDIEVTLHDGVLTIKGEKREEKEERKKDTFFSERRYGSFHRSFRLPGAIDEDKITASFDKGVLRISIAKRPAVAKPKAKTIQIKS